MMALLPHPHRSGFHLSNGVSAVVVGDVDHLDPPLSQQLVSYHHIHGRRRSGSYTVFAAAVRDGLPLGYLKFPCSHGFLRVNENETQGVG